MEHTQANGSTETAEETEPFNHDALCMFISRNRLEQTIDCIDMTLCAREAAEETVKQS